MTNTKIILRLFFDIILLIFILSSDMLFSQQKVNGRLIKKGVWKSTQINYVDGQSECASREFICGISSITKITDQRSSNSI